MTFYNTLNWPPFCTLCSLHIDSSLCTRSVVHWLPHLYITSLAYWPPLGTFCLCTRTVVYWPPPPPTHHTPYILLSAVCSALHPQHIDPILVHYVRSTLAPSLCSMSVVYIYSTHTPLHITPVVYWPPHITPVVYWPFLCILLVIYYVWDILTPSPYITSVLYWSHHSTFCPWYIDSLSLHHVRGPPHPTTRLSTLRPWYIEPVSTFCSCYMDPLSVHQVRGILTPLSVAEWWARWIT